MRKFQFKISTRAWRIQMCRGIWLLSSLIDKARRFNTGLKFLSQGAGSQLNDNWPNFKNAADFLG